MLYNNIKIGRLFQSDIPELVKYFAIDIIDPKNDEWQLYVEMLLNKDEPSQEVEELFTFHRRDTILSLLNTTVNNKQNYDWYKFCWRVIKKVGNKFPSRNRNQYWLVLLPTKWVLAIQLRNNFLGGATTSLRFSTRSILTLFCEKICTQYHKRDLQKEIKQSTQPTTLVSEIISLISNKTDEEGLKNAIDLKR